MNTQPHYDLIIGLDRSDSKADLHLIDTRTGQRRSQTIATSPEALWEWLAQLRQEYPDTLWHWFTGFLREATHLS